MKQQSTNKIYDPDNLIEAYSRYLGIDLFCQKIDGATIPILKHAEINELMLPTIDPSLLVKATE